MTLTPKCRILIVGRGTIGKELFRAMHHGQPIEILEKPGTHGFGCMDTEQWMYYRGEPEVHLCSHLVAFNHLKKIPTHGFFHLVVNAAGIAGDALCQKAGHLAVWEANVDFALDLDAIVRCLNLSTAGVYAEPCSTPKVEGCQLHASNLYVESKLEMERRLEERGLSLIIRIPAFLGRQGYPHDLVTRTHNWTYCEDAYQSYLTIDTLARVVQNIAETPDDFSGIFNIADGFHYLPDFIEDTHGPITIAPGSTLSETRTRPHLLDTTKAKKAGIL